MGQIDWSGAIGSAVQGLLNVGSTAIANNTQRKMQREQNAFNAQQADLNRQFQSREAEIARDWQEQQYNQYSSPSAMVRQYNEAGLNPALMYGSNLQSSTGSTSAPSGSSASGSTPSAFAADLTGIASAFLGLAKLKQEIKESKSRENANNAAAYASERSGLVANADVGLKQSQTRLNKQISNLTQSQVREAEQKIKLMQSQSRTEEARKQYLVAQKSLAAASQKQIDLKNSISDQFEQTFGYKADSDTINQIMGIVGNVIGTTIQNSFDIFKMFKNFKHQKELKL